MDRDKREVVEEIERMTARVVATNPAGHRLLLIGGFRYRLLDAGARMSSDLDYHWEGDLREKRDQLIALFRKKLLPEVARVLGYEGTAGPGTGPDSESGFVRIAELAFYKRDVPGSRIEIPVDITRIECLDKPIVRTRDGVVFLTASDADMAESKIISVLNRTYVEARDLVDIFFFQDRLGPDAAERLAKKLSVLRLGPAVVSGRVKTLAGNRGRFVRAIREIIETQLAAETAARIAEGGGAETVFDESLRIVREKTGNRPAE